MFKSVLISLFLLLLFPTPTLAAIDLQISNPVISNDEISVDISITGLSSSSCTDNKCYLQGFLTQSGSTNYFGFTQNNIGDWIAYQSNPDPEFITSNFLYCDLVDTTCSVSRAKMKFNYDDPKYKGPGDYDLKIGRYTGKSSSKAGDYSNILTISLSVAAPTPEPTPSPTPNPTDTPTPSSTSIPTPIKNSTPRPTIKPTKSPTPTPEEKVLSAEVQNLPSPTESPIATPKSTNEGGSFSKLPLIPILFVLAGFVFIGVASLPFLKKAYLKYNERRLAKNENPPKTY